MIGRLLQGLRSSVKSKVFVAMALCGLGGLVGGSLYVINGHPTGAIVSLTLFAIMVLTGMSLLIRMRWVQETEARRIHSRFRELRETMTGISGAVQRLPQAVAVVSSGTALATPANPAVPASSGETGAQLEGVSAAINGSTQVNSVPIAGRSAAAVADDGRRQSQILRHLAPSPMQDRGGRLVCAIAGRELRKHLADSFALEVLYPSTLAAQVGKLDCSAIIVDDAAFLAGTWFGADSAGGTLLANEILRTLTFCKEHGIPIYFIRTRRDSNTYTIDFEMAADFVISGRSSMEDWPEDYEFGLLGSIASFVDKKKGAPIA